MYVITRTYHRLHYTVLNAYLLVYLHHNLTNSHLIRKQKMANIGTRRIEAKYILTWIIHVIKNKSRNTQDVGLSNFTCPCHWQDDNILIRNAKS